MRKESSVVRAGSVSWACASASSIKAATTAERNSIARRTGWPSVKGGAFETINHFGFVLPKWIISM
jgi:hypothetical protein